MKRRHPGRDLRLGPERRRLRQLRRHRQRRRRAARGRAPREGAGRQGQGGPAALRGGPRQHDAARGRLPRGDSRRSPGIEIVSSNQYGGADVEGAYKSVETRPEPLQEGPTAALGVDGIFCPNESSAFAMLRVLQDNGWAGKVRFIGFDASDNLVKGLRDGHLEALVVQDPVRMGYLSVKTMVAHLKGGEGRAPHRHRRAAGHARHDGRAGDEESSRARPVEVADDRHQMHASALRDARHPQGVWRDRRGRRQSISRVARRRGLRARRVRTARARAR